MPFVLSVRHVQVCVGVEVRTGLEVCIGLEVFVRVPKICAYVP